LTMMSIQRLFKISHPLIFICAVIGGMLLATRAFAQDRPATQGTTQPAARVGGRGGRGPVSSSPRDRLPFSNSDFAALKPDLPTLFIAGDSTAATGDPDHRGWGAVIVDYFDTSRINLLNYAQGGASFPSFYASRWPKMVAAMKPGDFVVIELGHNGGHLDGIGDETREGPMRTGAGGPTVTIHTYGWYVRKFINDGRSKGATPIISSTSVRNIWTNPDATFNEARIVDQKPNYNPADDRVERGMGRVLSNGERSMLVWARQVAQEEKVPFVDHSNIAADLYERLGRAAVQKYHTVDRTHFSTEGAIAQAQTFIAGLKALPDMPLVGCLNDKGNAIGPYKPASK
jgi:lysophospholipase L1-like esterase